MSGCLCPTQPCTPAGCPVAIAEAEREAKRQVLLTRRRLLSMDEPTWPVLMMPEKPRA